MGAMSFISEDIFANTNIEATLAEIHVLAYFYHWGREECWNTPCTERGVFYDKIRQQIRAESGNGSTNSSTNSSRYKESV